MNERDPKKFDPSRAHLLDSDERERFMPTAKLLELLELRGDEVVLDYGAGTGRIALAAAAVLDSGRVVAVDESEEMLAHLRERLSGVPNAQAVGISANSVPLPDASVDRVAAVNLLHEVRGERALAEMRRLLRPGGALLVVDWERGRERESGPPDEILYTADEAVAELEKEGFRVDRAGAGFPFHFSLLARA